MNEDQAAKVARLSKEASAKAEVTDDMSIFVPLRRYNHEEGDISVTLPELHIALGVNGEIKTILPRSMFERL